MADPAEIKAKTASEEQVKFLVSCIRHSAEGKVCRSSFVELLAVYGLVANFISAPKPYIVLSRVKHRD